MPTKLISSIYENRTFMNGNEFLEFLSRFKLNVYQGDKIINMSQEIVGRIEVV